MALDTALETRVMFNMVIDTIEHQMQMSMMAGRYDVGEAMLQNAQNQIWRQVEQQAPVQEGWEFNDSDFGNIIEQSYPARLDLPRNSLYQLRADDFRDRQFMERRGVAAGKRLTADQNTRIANLVQNTGTIFYRATVDGTTNNTGYDAVKQATTILSERQVNMDMGVTQFINDRDAQRISSDIANRSNMNGLPETVYKNGMMAYNTAGADIYEGSYLPTLTGGATPVGVTVSTTHSDAPEGSTTVAGTEFPVDYRISSDITLSSTANYNVNDYITFAGVNSLGQHDKNNTGQLMSFKIVEKNDTANTIKVYPKPIALGDSNLDDDELAYANISTQIASGAAVSRLNTDASKQTNIFWCNDSIEIINGDAPLQFLGELDGMKVEQATLKSGTKLYMLYQGDINSVSFKCRLFTWYGITNRNPSANGQWVIA